MKVEFRPNPVDLDRIKQKETAEHAESMEPRTRTCVNREGGLNFCARVKISTMPIRVIRVHSWGELLELFDFGPFQIGISALIPWNAY